MIVCPTCHFFLYSVCNFCECGSTYALPTCKDYCKRAYASGWDGESILVYWSALPEAEGDVEIPEKRAADFKLTPPKDPPDHMITEKRELEWWEWARIKKKNKKLKAMQTTLNFE